MTPEQYLELCDLLPEPLLLISGSGSILAANRAALKTLGLAADQVSGRQLADFCSDAPDKLLDYLQLCSGSRQALAGGLTLRGPDNRDIGLRVDGAVLTPAARACDTMINLRCVPRETSSSRFVLLNRNIDELNQEITAHQYAEEQVRRLNEELEQRIEDRTAELQKAYRNMESFSYSVSHDLRSPLRSIYGFSQALIEDYADRLDDTGLDYLQRIHAGARKLDHLIDELLEFSRASRCELKRRSVSLSGICNEIVAELRLEEPHREVEVDVAGGMTVTADAALLTVVMDNLLRNAWKFTGKVPHPRIEVGRLDQGREQVFYVRDNGAGFDMRYAGKLFSAFQRLHAVDEFAGTGIGLATALGIVERHGGRMWADAEVDRGATFYLTLPQPG